MFFKLGKIVGEGRLLSRHEAQADHRNFRWALTVSLPSDAIFFALQKRPENAFFERNLKFPGGPASSIITRKGDICLSQKASRSLREDTFWRGRLKSEEEWVDEAVYGEGSNT